MTPEIRQMGLAQTPAGRLGTPAHTAGLMRFLMSDAAGWITGSRQRAEITTGQRQIRTFGQ
jgi:NAD(P)-dependent dehydrogenase (short-subunit alcohol dehydrogenase family)